MYKANSSWKAVSCNLIVCYYATIWNYLNNDKYWITEIGFKPLPWPVKTVLLNSDALLCSATATLFFHRCMQNQIQKYIKPQCAAVVGERLILCRLVKMKVRDTSKGCRDCVPWYIQHIPSGRGRESLNIKGISVSNPLVAIKEKLPIICAYFSRRTPRRT